MDRVKIDECGQIELPADLLAESDLKPGAPLLAITGEGSITLIDPERMKQRASGPMQQILAQFHRARTSDPDTPFFGGLTFEQYGALSEEQEQALWDKLSAEAHQKVKVVEQEIPTDFRPAGQERR